MRRTVGAVPIVATVALQYRKTSVTKESYNFNFGTDNNTSVDDEAGKHHIKCDQLAVYFGQIILEVSTIKQNPIIRVDDAENL